MTLESTVRKYRELFKSGPVITTAHDINGPHYYVSPTTGEKYHSVTYYTSFIKDPSLANWKQNRALDYVMINHPKVVWKELTLQELIDNAKLAPEGEFKGAGSIGTQTHKWMQEWFEAWIDEGIINLTDEQIDQHQLPENVDCEVISGCRAIKRFLKETGAIPVAVELPLVDEELKVGGQIDSLVVMPNESRIYGIPKENETQEEWMNGGYKVKYKPYLAFCDLKTSNQGKKPSYFLQVRGFYQRMIWKTFHIRPKKTFILHTSKLNGQYSMIDITDMKFLEKDVKHLVELSRSWDKMVECSKPKVITI